MDPDTDSSGFAHARERRLALRNRRRHRTGRAMAPSTIDRYQHNGAPRIRTEQLELSPVRDAYDIITAARKPDGSEPLTAAHNLLPVEVQYEVEDHLARSDERFAEEAPIHLQPTEDSRADWNAIGTTAASELHGFRLAHVRITLHDDRVLIARTTNNGHRFETAGNVSSTVTLCQRANLSTLFDTIGLSARKLKNEIDVYHSRRRSGTIVDTTDDDPLDRLRRLNRPSPRPAPQRPGPAPNGRTDSPTRTR